MWEGATRVGRDRIAGELPYERVELDGDERPGRPYEQLAHFL